MLSCYVLLQVARLWKNVSWDPWSLLNGHSVVLDRAQWKGNSHGTQEHILYEGSCHVTNSVFCLEACLVWIRGERNRETENKSERDIETQTEREERKRLLLIRLIKLLPSELSRFTFHNMAGSSIDPCCSGGADSKESSSRLHTVLQLLSEDTCPLSLITLGENKSKHWAAVKMALNLFQGNTAKTPTEVSVSHSHSYEGCTSYRQVWNICFHKRAGCWITSFINHVDLLLFLSCDILPDIWQPTDSDCYHCFLITKVADEKTCELNLVNVWLHLHIFSYYDGLSVTLENL